MSFTADISPDSHIGNQSILSFNSTRKDIAPANDLERKEFQLVPRIHHRENLFP